MIGFQQTVRGVHPTAAGALSAACHERVSGDREPVGRNFRKFQNDVVLLSAGVRAHRGRRRTAVLLLSFFIYSYLRNETRGLSISLSFFLFLSVCRSVRGRGSIRLDRRRIRARAEKHACMKISRENEAHRMRRTCIASGNIAHLPRFSSR